MAIAGLDRVGKGPERPAAGLRPFVQGEPESSPGAM
jgi:hypothetical protein